MFTRDQVTLRPADWPDRDQMYLWHCDAEIEILSGWGPRRSKTGFEARFRDFLEQPPDGLVSFVIEHQGQPTGRIDLAEIDREHRRASLGLFIGDKEKWGLGIGKIATITMLDYAFSVENLSRVWAQTYGFNKRSQRLMRSVGFTEEGILRGHEVHNGQARDMYVYGMLAHEFFERHDTLFSIPDASAGS